MISVSKRPHGYRDQQDEKGTYLRRQLSARVGKCLIGVRSPRGIEWYRPSKRPHGYRGQQEEMGTYLTGHRQMSARVSHGLIAIR